MEESGDEEEYFDQPVEQKATEEEEESKQHDEQGEEEEGHGEQSVKNEEYVAGYDNPDMFEMSTENEEGVFPPTSNNNGDDADDAEQQAEGNQTDQEQQEEINEKRAKAVQTPMHDKQNAKEKTISPPQVNVLRMDDAKNGLCNKARDLLVDLKRSEWLPTYDEDGVRSVCEEIKLIVGYIKEMGSDTAASIQEQPELMATLQALYTAAKRNQRCLFAYLNYRMEKIEQLVWELGGSVSFPAKYAAKLSKSEMDHYLAYQKIVSEYMISCDMDLHSNLVPPKDLFIEVRSLKDAGEIVLENGVVNFTKNSTHFLKRSHIEHLIRQNVLEQI